MLISTVLLIFSLVLAKGNGGNLPVTQVSDMKSSGSIPTALYKKFQPRVPNGKTFMLQSLSRVFVKVPGITLALSHNYPMLYELQFEAMCRVPDSGSAFQLEFLFNDHLLDENKFYKNDGSTNTVDWGLGSQRSWWFNPMLSSHHFICSRSEIIYLSAGIHVIDVGVRLINQQHIEVLNGQLTVKLTQYNSQQTSIGDLPRMSV